MSLKSDLYTAAKSFTGLTALIGTNPTRWYDMRLLQGSALPAVVVQVIAGVPVYATTGRFHTQWTRVQFTIWGATPGSDSAAAVETQLLLFLDQLNLLNIPGLAQYPTQVVLQRDAMQTQIEPPIYQRIIDARIFANDKF